MKMKSYTRIMEKEHTKVTPAEFFRFLFIHTNDKERKFK